ncbi:hypothetical protein D3C83_61390 [compost metagenome]
MKPKPNRASASMQAPFLSRPAARPTGLGNERPITVRAQAAGAGGAGNGRPAPSRTDKAFRVTWCAVSASSANSSGRTSGYMTLF